MYISCMTTTAVASTTLKTAYLARPHGRLGYDVAGAGPLVLLVLAEVVALLSIFRISLKQ